jgi:hypothetical protein
MCIGVASSWAFMVFADRNFILNDIFVLSHMYVLMAYIIFARHTHVVIYLTCMVAYDLFFSTFTRFDAALFATHKPSPLSKIFENREASNSSHSLVKRVSQKS